MGFIGLCEGDDIVTTLREVFGQNIIRVPEERYRPLTVLAARDGKTSFRGSFPPLVLGNPPLEFDPSLFAQSRMSNISGKRTSSVDLDLGLNVLDGLLGGFGVPSVNIKPKFDGAKKVSYTFGDVYRLWVDINSVGRMLKGRSLDKEDPAAAIFFGNGAYSLLVLDSVITSSDFTISVDRVSKADFKLDIPAIKKIVGDLEVGVSVSSSTGLDLTFKGPQQLAFAFSCVRFALSETGVISQLVPDAEAVTLYGMRATIAKEHSVQYAPDRVLLSPGAAMIEIDPLE